MNQDRVVSVRVLSECEDGHRSELRMYGKLKVKFECTSQRQPTYPRARLDPIAYEAVSRVVSLTALTEEWTFYMHDMSWAAQVARALTGRSL